MRLGPSKGRRACMTVRLSSSRMSPARQGKATQTSSITRTAAAIAAPSKYTISSPWLLPSGKKSFDRSGPSCTAFEPSFRESFHPVYAATTELKNVFSPVLFASVGWSSVRIAGTDAVTVLRLPSACHSQLDPSCIRAASALAMPI